MPTPIKMEQDEDGTLIAEDPFFGADPDEEVTDENVDYGNDLTGEEEETDEDEKEGDEKKDEDPDEDEKGDDKDEDEEGEEEDDVDPDAEGEEEDDEEEEEEPEPEPKAKEQRIPKQRFDEVNERMKAAEAALATREAEEAAAKLAEADAFDFDAKEREYMELVVDSEFDKAQEIRREIRAAEQAKINASIMTTSTANREQTKIELAFAETVKDLEADYPTMQPGAEGFQQELVDEVLSLHEGFVNSGMTADLAIAKAVKYVAKMNDIVPLSEQGEDEGEEEAPPPKKKTSKKAMRTKVKAKVQQPGKMPKGSHEKSIDLDSMSEDEFDALPESKKKELRGDFL